MSDMWEAGCDPFENGYDPKAAERLYRERITDLMAECEGWRQRHVRSAGRAADFAAEVEWLRKETTRLCEEWGKTKQECERLQAENENLSSAVRDMHTSYGLLLKDDSRHRGELARLKLALTSIAKNTCCEGCQEAARVAQKALQP